MCLLLTTEEYKFVLTKARPAEPGDGATDEETQAYWTWKKANDMARCYILASMSNVLQHQHESSLSWPMTKC